MRIRDMLAVQETDEAAGTEIPAEPERPAWLPENFQTPEALASSWDETRRELGRLQTERDNDRKQYEAALAAITEQQQAQQWSPQTDPMISAYQRALDEGDAATALAIQMQVSQAATAQMLDQRFSQFEERVGPAVSDTDREVVLRLAEQQVAPEFGDRWPEIAGAINDRLAETIPGVQPTVDGYARAIREAAMLAEYGRLRTMEQQAEAERQAKLAAQTLTGSTARVPTDTDEKRSEWERVKAADSGGAARVWGG